MLVLPAATFIPISQQSTAPPFELGMWMGRQIFYILLSSNEMSQILFLIFFLNAKGNIKGNVYKTYGFSNNRLFITYGPHSSLHIHSLLYDWDQEAKPKHLGIVGHWTLKGKKTICIAYNKIVSVKSSHCTCWIYTILSIKLGKIKIPNL